MASTPTTAARRPTRARRSETARPRGVARRIALLEATLELLAEIGADALTHRRVADHAGLPLASTTYWFDSKEHLLTEALRFAAERDASRLHIAAETLLARCDERRTPPTAAEIVAVVLDPCVEADPAAPDHHAAERAALLATYALMLEAARRPALQALSLQWSDAYRDTVGDLLARAGSDRAADDARMLMAATDGLLVDRLATGTEGDFDLRSELERLARALIAAGGSR